MKIIVFLVVLFAFATTCVRLQDPGNVSADQTTTTTTPESTTVGPTAPSSDSNGGITPSPTEINECLDKNGGCQQTCTNTVGSYNCSCSSGYTVDGHKCIDIAECSVPNACPMYQTCVELPGSYRCDCPKGYFGQNCDIIGKYIRPFTAEIHYDWTADLSDSSSKAFATLSNKLQKTIMTILETGSNSTLQADNTAVQVTWFTQKMGNSRRKRAISKDTIVVSGDVLTENKVDKNDFKTSLSDGLKGLSQSNTDLYISSIISSGDACTHYTQCDPDTTTCEDTDSQATCKCKDGYEPVSSDKTRCKDINECAGKPIVCLGGNDNCVNTKGKYVCLCPNGFYWSFSRKVCESSCKPDTCKNGGTCQSIGKEWICSCTYGWEGKDCSEEEDNARDKNIAIISISVILGTLCLILLITVIALCIKQKRNTYRNGNSRPSHHFDSF